MLHIRDTHSPAAMVTGSQVQNGEDVRTTRLSNGYALHSYQSREAVPMAEAMRLLSDHAGLMRDRMVGGGGPDFDPELHCRSFWAVFETVLPPNGTYYLATDPEGAYVATGALRKLSASTGEMKHLYVVPEARRAGLGRALVEARFADARAMGMTTLVADTFAVNAEMPSLYDKLGFERIPPFEDSATATYSPELVPHMLFFRLKLAEG